jgi:hypothetical protein
VRCKGAGKGLTVVEQVDVSWKISDQLRPAVGGDDEQLVVHHDAALPAIPSETTSSGLTSSGLD